MTRTQYGAFDISKLLLSVFVCAVHTCRGVLPVFPWTRIAVPVFFLISSFLFFSGVFGERDKSMQKRRLAKFVLRNLRLYAFWFAVLLPVVLVMKKYFAGGIVHGTLRFFADILLGSTFPASWYISALIIGCVIMYFVRGRAGNIAALLLSCAAYFICCLMSNYRGFFEGSAMEHIFVVLYPGTFYNSFPAGLVWIAVGKLLAAKRCGAGLRKTDIGASAAACRDRENADESGSCHAAWQNCAANKANAENDDSAVADNPAENPTERGIVRNKAFAKYGDAERGTAENTASSAECVTAAKAACGADISDSSAKSSRAADLSWVGDRKLAARRTAFAVCAVLSMGLLYIEYFIIKRMGCSVDNDCYFALLPLCIFTFLFLETFRSGVRGGAVMRKMSTVIYCMHASVASVLLMSFGGRFDSVCGAVCLFLLSLFVSAATAVLFMRLEKTQPFKWLRYAF